MQHDLNLERSLRRRLRRLGMRLHKTPSRHWSREWYGRPGYMVVENFHDMVKLGCRDRVYDATLEDVEHFVERLEQT